MTGTIKHLRQTFGFIKADDGRDFFFHDSDVLGASDIELGVGDRVSFEVVDPAPIKGPRARGVAWLWRGDAPAVSTGNRPTNSAQEANQ